MKLPFIHHEIISNNINLISEEINMAVSNRIQAIADDLNVNYQELKNRIRIDVSSPDMSEDGKLIGLDKCYIPKVIFYTIILDGKVKDSFSISIDFNCKQM